MHKSRRYSSLPVVLLLFGMTECMAQGDAGTQSGESPAVEAPAQTPTPSAEGGELREGGRRGFKSEVERRLETIDPRHGDAERFREEQRRRSASEFAARERETVERDSRERAARERETRQRAAAGEQAIRGGRR